MMQAGAWVQDPETNDDSAGLQWLRTHRLYCLALVAIVLATMVGSSWADQQRGRVGMTSSSPEAAVHVAEPPASPPAPATGVQPGR